MPTLRQVLKQAAPALLGSEGRCAELLDEPVVAIHLATGAPCASHSEMFAEWPGAERNVRQWYALASGASVGIVEEPGGEIALARHPVG